MSAYALAKQIPEYSEPIKGTDNDRQMEALGSSPVAHQPTYMTSQKNKEDGQEDSDGVHVALWSLPSSVDQWEWRLCYHPSPKVLLDQGGVARVQM